MKKWMNLRIACGMAAAFGWWGLLYPELTMSPDTYRVIEEETSVQAEGNVVEWEFGNDIYWNILHAERDSICLRSKLLTEIEAAVHGGVQRR